MSCYWVRLDGRLPLTEVAPHTPPTWETWADGGTGAIDFALSLSPRQQHPLLRTNVKVEVMLGATPVATGLLTEPDRTTWEVHAEGVQSVAYRLLAVDGLGNTTRDIGIAIESARAALRWNVTRPAGMSGVVSGDSTEPMMLGALLDAFAEQTGQRWGVDGLGRLFLRPDPTTISYMVTPEAAVFGVADEGQATQLVGRYVNAGGVNETVFEPAVSPPIVRHEAIDLTERGALTEAEARAILAGALALGKAQTRWTSGVELGNEQITRSGVPALLPLVTAGELVRVTGTAADATTAAPWLDVVIGKTRYTAGARTIYIEPVNTAPRNLRDIIAAA